MSDENRNERELFRAVSALKTVEECREFFQDLCTPSELSDMADRWQVAKLLAEGVAYRDIYERTGVSTATVTRVAKALREGKGYKQVLTMKGET